MNGKSPLNHATAMVDKVTNCVIRLSVYLAQRKLASRTIVGVTSIVGDIMPATEMLTTAIAKLMAKNIVSVIQFWYVLTVMLAHVPTLFDFQARVSEREALPQEYSSLLLDPSVTILREGWSSCHTQHCV